MTGTLKVLGKDATTIEWDTDEPTTVEQAVTIYGEAMRKGFTPLDTSDPKGAKAMSSVGYKPGVAEVTDITMVPRFAGGR